MKARCIPLLLLSVLWLAACQHGKNELILGTWKGIKLENTTIDSFFIKSQQVIDTLGTHNDPDHNFEIYGTSNMDSVRHAMQLQHDSAFVIQSNRIKTTIFQFTKDKVAYHTFNANMDTDTAKWNFDDEGALILEDRNTGGNKAMKRMVIMALTDTIMVLKVWSNNDSSKITFRHEKE